MRVSTNTIFQSGITRITELTSSQVKLQQQISTGRKIQSPSDDPVGASRALQIRQASGINDQYTLNREAAIRHLSGEETALNNVTDVFLALKSKMVAAGNGAYSDQDRSFLALDVRAAISQLVGLANTRDGDGNYIFAGYQSQNPAFVETATGATYQGDNNQRLLQVSASRQIEISDSGASVFQAGGNDIFQTLTDFAVLLETPVTDTAAYNAGLQSAQTSLNSALDTVLTTRAMVGTRLNELDALEEFGQELKLQYATSLSAIEDLDYAQAISSVMQQQVILEAAQKTFAQASGMSLFNYF